MKLCEFDEVRILSVDYRYETEKNRLLQLFQSRGANPVFYIDGKGQQLSRRHYNQISCAPPPTWQDGWGAWNHFRAFKSMISHAGFNNVLIAEDDLILTDDFDEIVNRIKIPNDWDMIYYGANHTNAKTRTVAMNVLRCFGSTTTHLVAFRRTIFDDVLSLPADRTIDWSIAHRLHEKYHCYAIYPAVALQKPNYSQIWQRHVDYSPLWSSRGMAI